MQDGKLHKDYKKFLCNFTGTNVWVRVRLSAEQMFGKRFFIRIVYYKGGRWGEPL